LAKSVGECTAALCVGTVESIGVQARDADGNLHLIGVVQLRSENEARPLGFYGLNFAA
jgi:hypothetical protein